MDRILNSNITNRNLSSTIDIIGGGEMGDRIRAFDWTKTWLGPISAWPLALRVAVNMILQSPAPMVILWGTEGVLLYNNAYIAFAGGRHPALLGTKGEDNWHEADGFIQNVITKGLKGEALSYKNFPFTVYRNNKPEEIWINIDASPILDDSGSPGGVLILNVETTEHVNAVQSLKVGEERLRLVIEGTDDGIWDFDMKTRTAFWNNRLYKMLGYSLEEVEKPGYDFMLTIIHPEDKAKVQASFVRASTLGVYYDVEYRAKHRDGHYIYLHGKGKPVYNEQGQITRIAGVTRDVTERKQAEKELQESKELFSSIFNQTTVGIAQCDLNANFTLVNDRYCEIVGRSKEELYQLRLYDITHPEDLPANIPLLERTATEGIPFKIEKRYMQADGTPVWVTINASAVKDAAGKPKYILGVCQDITERKQAEEALKESEQRFRIMADAAPNIVWALNDDSSIKYVNKFTLEFLGITLDKFIADSWMPYVHPDDLELTSHAITEAFQKRKIFTIEQRLLRHDGEYRWLLTQGAPSYYPNGELYGYIGSSIDITARKQAQKELGLKNAQLVRINNDLDNFIYTASHDLRSPVVNLEGLLLALNKRIADTILPEASTLLDLMGTSVKKLNKTIKDLTEITKAQKGLEEAKEQVFFKNMLVDIIADLPENMRKLAPTIKEDFQVDSIWYPRGSLRSILYNLLTNAFKYRSDKRPLEITIKTDREGDFVVLSVEDNGLGISKQQLPKLFTMFKRLHTHVEGTGIGLYIIKRLVENNGGKIEVISEPEKGSTFRVYFLREDL